MLIVGSKNQVNYDHTEIIVSHETRGTMKYQKRRWSRIETRDSSRPEEVLRKHRGSAEEAQRDHNLVRRVVHPVYWYMQKTDAEET